MESENVDYERLEELANEASEVAITRRPQDTDWGFYAWGDAPAGIGGGIGGFFWFPSEEEMLDFIKKYGLFVNSPRSDLDFDKIIRATHDAIDEYKGRAINKDQLLGRINENLRHASQFDWMGTFAELKNGSGSFAKKVLEEFRENSRLDPVAQHEEDDFCEYLSTFGV